ncbi:hypothetical protein COB11_00065 [Candidatus Aerophobetes bacterium]|uniref:Protein kinase domain-containing protein n=1 Tax=Aerophobetes bacterium TaxID=2030807 RepID=A0A2A4YNY7_UNCAE|nr:MAG: hypothetical protein COB11_00065 [Candidatus Aerophobetes bacterium]
MQNAASGLAYLHEEGFLHRDVKPENILVFEDVEKLADLESVHSLDVFKQGCYGTLYYLPKEVMKCEVVSNDPKQLKSIDVYAYGMSIFMLLKQEQYTSPFLSDINDNTKLGKYTNELSFVMAAAEHPELTKVHLDPLLDAKKVARLDEAGELRALMTACLRGNPNARPSFDDIVHRLEASD